MKQCIFCKYISNKACGKVIKIRGSSGSVGYIKEKDNRCKEEKK
jgi:hypothetical protein